MCFVTLHVAFVACSWIVARLLISGESMPIVSKEFSAARGFSRPRAVVCGHYYCVGPKVGSVFSLVAHSCPSSISQAILIGIQIVANRKSSPSPLRGSSACSVQECPGAFQHFRLLGTVTQETCYGCKKWNNQTLHYVGIFSGSAI